MFQASVSIILLGSSASLEGSLTDLQNHLHATRKSQCCALRVRLGGEFFQVHAGMVGLRVCSKMILEVDFRVVGSFALFCFKCYSPDSAIIMTSVKFAFLSCL